MIELQLTKEQLINLVNYLDMKDIEGDNLLLLEETIEVLRGYLSPYEV